MNCLKELKLDAENTGSFGQKGWMDVKASVLNSYDPNTEALIASVNTSTEKSYNEIVDDAVKFSKIWRTVPAPERGEFIRQIGEALRQHKDALGSLVSMEMGKSKQEGDGEVQEMIDMADFAVGQSRMLYGLTMPSERFEHRLMEQWQPLGVVGVITAFNFPVAVWAWNAFLGAICGNAIIWKPSPKTPLCAVAVMKICEEVATRMGVKGVFSLFISDENALANQFVCDSRMNLISFTGSSQVGREVGVSVAKRMGKCLLELGGNSAIIADETADLKLLIPAIVFGAIGTSGQRCTSTRRVIIHESIYSKVKSALLKAYEQISIGDPLDENNLMGPLVDSLAVEQYQKAIEEAKQNGDNILCGAKVLDRKGYYVEPTLIEAENNAPLVQRETFAPILYLMTYKDFDLAIEMQNDVNQGLSSALFSSNLQHCEQFLSSVGSDCGLANINIGTSGAEIGGAFGGEKETGGGREAGSDAWRNYMRRQTNTINRSNKLPLAQGIKFDVT